MSAVIWKQNFFHGNEIVEDFQNCKCFGVDQDHFRKYLYSCTKFMQNDDLKTARIIFKVLLLLSYFRR